MSVPVAMKVGTGVTVGPELGELVGVPVGKAVAVVGAGIVGAGLGELVGCPVGTGVGEPDGMGVGMLVGTPVGIPVGMFVGIPDGALVGAPVGVPEGSTVGAGDGSGVGMVGLGVGALVMLVKVYSAEPRVRFSVPSLEVMFCSPSFTSDSSRICTLPPKIE